MNALRWMVRLYIWHELPGWGRLYSRFVGDYRRDASWAGEPSRTIRGKLHGYEIDLDLSRWSERATYFLGRFYDLETQLLLTRILRPGDRFVDIGANIGMISLLGSRLVSPEGVVDAFEPNPRCAARIRSFIQRNAITNIRFHEAALGAVEGPMRLAVPLDNSGEGTLTMLNPPGAGPRRSVEFFDVPVRVGDEGLTSDTRSPVVIKIDVEGFEYHVLSGLSQTLRAQRPLVTTEVNPEHLARAGHTPGDLFVLMHAHGYEGHSLSLRRRGLHRALKIDPADASHHTIDVLWVPSDGPARARLPSLLS